MRPFDRFDGKIEEGVGKHQVQSLSQYIGKGAHPLRGGNVALLFPNKMKRDDNEKGDTRFDHP